LNPRPSPWQGDALPLSYSRSEKVEEEWRILLTRAGSVKQCHGYLRRLFPLQLIFRATKR